MIRYCNRPFDDVDHMNAELIRIHNERVSPGDVVYHLGDFAFRDAGRYMMAMRGQFHLIRGNHDKWARKSIKSLRIYNLTWLGDYKEIKVFGRRIVLCHYPFARWNAGHHGSIHFHGHSHGTFPSDGIRRLDVGVDCHGFKPLEITEELLERLEAEAPIPHHEVRK